MTACCVAHSRLRRLTRRGGNTVGLMMPAGAMAELAALGHVANVGFGAILISATSAALRGGGG